MRHWGCTVTETPQQAARRLSVRPLAEGYKPVALHEYQSADGQPLFWRIRLEHPDDRKWIRPMKRTDKGYVPGEPEFPNGKPLYRLPDMARNPEATVWIVEGEKCADALAKLGVVATTSGSADSAGKADWSCLKGRRAVIWPDFDEAGAKYAQAVVEALCTVGAASIELVDIRTLGLPEKGDWVDWLERNPNATVVDIEALPRVKVPETVGVSRVELIRGSNVKPEPISWYWPGWLAAGKFHVLAGAPGTGKTTIACALAATLTSGGRWPDDTRASVGSVLIWSGEDDPGDTLAPRLIAMGADMSRVHFVGNVMEADGRRPFDPARDVSLLCDAAKQLSDLRLLIVDPVVSAVAGDSHKNGETRRALQPLVDLGHELGCAVLGISHFSKGTSGRDPVERVTGSIAFGALARIVLATAKINDPDGNEARLFARAKSNIGLDSGGFYYDLQSMDVAGNPGLQASAVLWGDPVDGEARELLAQAEQSGVDADGGVLGECKDFLKVTLAAGPLPAKQIFAEARNAGLSEKTVRRAKDALGIKPAKTRFDGGWEWSLPTQVAQDDQDSRTCPTKFDGHLGESWAPSTILPSEIVHEEGEI